MAFLKYCMDTGYANRKSTYFTFPVIFPMKKVHCCYEMPDLHLLNKHFIVFFWGFCVLILFTFLALLSVVVMVLIINLEI